MTEISMITIAPVGYDGRADFVCTGRHDERVIQRAVQAASQARKNVFFYNGIYRIDGFTDCGDGGPRAAVCIPNDWREIALTGENHEYGFQKRFDNGVVWVVSREALDAIETETDVLRGRWTSAGIQNGSSLRLENIAVVLADNQHAIRCVDLRRTDRVEVKNLSLAAYGDLIAPDSEVGLAVAPPVPAVGCIGLTMTDGSNYNYSNYVNVQTWGFDEGIQVGGEHVVCINCGASVGRYGFTFGNYKTNCGSNHPITMINCLDERNIHLPLLNRCGDNDPNGNWIQGGQELTMIGFNVERVADRTPGGQLGDAMREVHPGTWCGSIEFTAQPAWSCTNTASFQLWESDGSGRGIRTRNSLHRAVCTAAERRSYYPAYGQQVFDTDLNRLVICIDPDKRTWVDCSGNPVE